MKEVSDKSPGDCLLSCAGNATFDNNTLNLPLRRGFFGTLHGLFGCPWIRWIMYGMCLAECSIACGFIKQEMGMFLSQLMIVSLSWEPRLP